MGRNAKQPRRKMRFTLRAMFVLTTLVAVATFVYQQQSRMRQAVQQIQAVYGKVEYHPEMLPGLDRRTDNWFASVKAVRLWGGNIDNETLKLLREFNRLEILHLRSSNVTHEGLQGLASNSKLEELSLEDCQGIHGSAFDELKKFKNLLAMEVSFADMGVLDFAGGIVVHVTAGFGALVACIMVGKRSGYPRGIEPPHNLTMTVTGTAMLWLVRIQCWK